MGQHTTRVLRGVIPLFSSRRVPAVLALCVGCALSVLAFKAVRKWEQRRVQSRFERMSGNCVAAVQKTVALGLGVFRSIESFYAASQVVERHEFRAFVRNILSRHRAIAALQWAPRIAAAERDAHEAAGRREGLAGYRITERDGSGRRVPVRPRAEYFPVYYSEPSEGRDRGLGFDLASHATYGEVMARARDGARPVATGRLELDGAGSGSLAVKVFLPVYRNNLPHETPAERQSHLQGFVVGVFRVAELVDEALGDLALGGIHLCLFDESAPPGRRFLCSYPPGVARAEPVRGAAGTLRRRAALDVGGRQWSLLCVPAEEFSAGERAWLPWAVLAAGLVVTALSVAYLAVVMGRAARVERLVAKRTDELSCANRDLANEVDRRNRVEGALRESEERFRALVESTSDWVWEVDASGVYTYVSPQVKALLGYEPKAVIGKTPFDFMPADEAKRVAAEFRRIVEARKPFVALENMNLHHDGREVVLETSGMPFFGENDELRGYRGIDRDITERKRAEEALRGAQEELEERVRERTVELDEAIEALRAEIAEHARAEEQIRRQTAVLEAMNQIFRESLTCEKDEDVARTCLAVVERLTGSRFGFIGEFNPAGRFDTIAMSDPGWAKCRMPKGDAVRMIHDMAIRGLFGKVLRDEEPLIVNEPASHPEAVGVPEGHPALTSFLGVPLKHGGRTIGMVALANKEPGYDQADLEALEALSVAFVEALMRKRAEQALRQAHDELERRVHERTVELERSNAELEQFAYVASHDLKEPLRMVRSYVELLAQRYQDRLDSDANEFIQFAVDGARRMEELISDLLMYSRVGMRGQGFRPTSCGAVLDDVLRNLAASIKESGAEVTHDPLPTVMADPTQLLQLFQNLIGNAIKFRRDEPPRVHVAVEPDGGLYRFSVRDNGVGIEPQSAARIFMIFQRLHARDAYPGTGIGLAICKRIVERHGGRIWVESTPDEGSTFLFTLPAAGEGSA